MKKGSIIGRIFVVAAVLLALNVGIFGAYYYNNKDNFHLEYIKGLEPITTDYSEWFYEYTTDPCFKIDENEDFKILQLTDIHLAGGLLTIEEDRKAIDAIYSLVEATMPDLIIITGDLVYATPNSLNVDNKRAIEILAMLMNQMGVPWTCTFGNHDAEYFNTHSYKQLAKQLTIETKGLFQDKAYNISGRGNAVINIKNSDDTMNMALFLIDSNSYVEEAGVRVYDNIHENQVKWYSDKVKELNEQAGYIVPSLLFFHIPLMEYETAWNLYEAGSNEVIYHYGTVGEKNGAINASSLPSRIFDEAVNLGSTQGIFCGHDHLNDFSITYKGIRLTYGQSIDYLAYSEDDYPYRGGTLITLRDCNKGYEASRVLLKDIIK